MLKVGIVNWNITEFKRGNPLSHAMHGFSQRVYRPNSTHNSLWGKFMALLCCNIVGLYLQHGGDKYIYRAHNDITVTLCVFH